LSTIPQHQWVSKLVEFDFRVEYKSGTTNIIADALLCQDTEAQAMALPLPAPSFKLFEDLRGAYTTETALVSMR
jgi:hypothetical protein